MNPEIPTHLMRLFEVVRQAQPSLSEAQREVAENFLKFLHAHYKSAESQIFQDLFVLYVLAEKKNGFFIDFGATNGLSLSNSYLLEKSYGWRGILAEPARCWHAALKANRDCSIDLRCVWSETGKTLSFNETALAEYSTIDAFSDSDFNAAGRTEGTRYPVESVSLNDLARAHNAPADIDYLSMDTEGSELFILKKFDFDQYRVKVITVEHNFTEPARENIFSLLRARGYRRVFELFSGWDDWYVHSSVMAQAPHLLGCL